MGIFMQRGGNATHPATRIYTVIARMARQPDLYISYGVPDTLQGRFEMLALHLAIILIYIKGNFSGKNYKELIQQLCDLVVADVEESLRSLPVSESKVGGQLKKFVEGFYGRLIAYNDALETENAVALENVVRRNIYALQSMDSHDQVNNMTLYILQTIVKIREEKSEISQLLACYK